MLILGLALPDTFLYDIPGNTGNNLSTGRPKVVQLVQHQDKRIKILYVIVFLNSESSRSALVIFLKYKHILLQLNVLKWSVMSAQFLAWINSWS